MILIIYNLIDDAINNNVRVSLDFYRLPAQISQKEGKGRNFVRTRFQALVMTVDFKFLVLSRIPLNLRTDVNVNVYDA